MAKSFEYEWWNVEAQEATGKTIWEVKAKSKDGAIKQFKKMAQEHDEYIRRVRPDFKTIIFWDTLTLDHKGYRRRF